MCVVRIVCALVAIATSSVFGGQAGEQERLKVAVGEQRILMEPQAQIQFFPDEPISVLSEKPLTVLMCCGNRTFRFVGKDWGNLFAEGEVLAPSGGDAFDQGYAGICATTRIGQTLYSLYHGENHINKKSEVAADRNQMASMMTIGLAASNDDGKTFQRSGAVLTSATPYEPGKECGGVGDVTMCRDREDRYLLAYYTDFARSQGRNVQICHARCAVNDRAAPGKWFKYHDGGFSQPGLGGKETYVMCLSEAGADAWCPHVVYSKALDRYLLTFGVTVNSETDGRSFYKPLESGIYLSCSKDGIKWSVPTLAVAEAILFIKGYAGLQHPTLHLTGSTKDGVKGVLLYAYTPDWGKVPHHLAGREISLTLEQDINPPAYKGPFGPRMHLAHRLKGTKWKNTNNATFEWTHDGRVIHNGTQKWWRAVDGRSIEVFFDNKNKATLSFDKDLTHFDQPIGDGKKFEGRRADSVTAVALSSTPALADRLKGTKWMRDGQPDTVFEWTSDGLLKRNGQNCKWMVLDDTSAEVRVGSRIDRWVFAADMKTVVQHGDSGKWKSTWKRVGE